MTLPTHPTPWPLAEPATLGFDPVAHAAATAFAAAHETPWPRDLRAHLEAGYFEPPPDNAVLGPLPDRGPPNGVVLRHGRLAARWGDTRQADATFSVAKSYLALLAGIAVGDGLIRDLDAPVGRDVDDPAFAGPRNGAVTWRHLLQNTSEWQGTLFGKSDVIDRGRDLRREGAGPKGIDRTLQAPGTHWEYNDVRVNALSLALLHRFRRALPGVFAERIMAPLGASADWIWAGYDTAWVTLDGTAVQSVPGGSHWGGGVVIHAEDQARIGQLALRDGAGVLPQGWVGAMRTPCALNAEYGFLTWLNTGRTRWPAASAAAFCFSGAGGNITWVEPALDMVVVARWLDPAALGGCMARMVAAASG